MLESSNDKRLEEVQSALVQLKEMKDFHKYVNLPKILKVKHYISTIIEDFNIDHVLDEETQVNIMT